MMEYRELVSDGYTLRGFLTKDENCHDLCVYFHGFTGHKNEHNFMFKDLQEILLGLGIASLRFDYRGSGDSDGKFSEQNFDTVLADARRMVEEGYRLNNNKPIIVLGFSMGGAAASRMSVEYKDIIKKAVLISPAAKIENSLISIFKNKIVDGRYVDMGGYYIDISFKESLKDYNMYLDCDKFKNPVLICQGACDQAVYPIDSLRYTHYYPNYRYYLVPGAPHGYGKVRYRQTLYGIISDFLKESK